MLSKTIVYGDCDFCGSKDVAIVTCEDLSIDFEPLFNLYTNHPSALKSLKVEGPHLLFEHLAIYWPKLFNPVLKLRGCLKFLIDQIGKGYVNYNKEIFEKPVEFRYLLEIQDPSEDLELQWESFSSEIKLENRFFLNRKPEMKLLASVFESLGILYPKDTYFYRARISDQILQKSELGKPDYKLAKGGRANPIGIPYLYISNSEETTLYETRILLHETITVGTFMSTEPLKVMSLKSIQEYGPFQILDKNFEIEDFIKYRPYLLKLGTELSKPVRKQDGDLDYLPTQFLCEFIKSICFDAVEYKSAMNDDGYNLAVFNDHKLICVDSKFYTITDLKYKWQLIKVMQGGI